MTGGKDADTQLTGASQAGSVFLSHLRHELRTPLNAILGYSEMLLEDVPEDKELIDGLQDIHSSGRHLLALVNNILAPEKIEANPPPAVILLDLLMPEMGGFVFLKLLRTRVEWQEIPVIVVTAKQLTAEERQWLGQTTQQVIAKGQSAHVDLSHAVRAVLRRTAPAPAE